MKIMKNEPKINFIDIGCSEYLIEPWISYPCNINFILGFDISNLIPYKKQLKIKNISNKIFRKAVFNVSGKKSIHICGKKQNSSLFIPNMKIIDGYLRRKNNNEERIAKRKKDFKVVKKCTVNCVRLEDVIEKLNVNFDFIKIDTQGADFQVIKSLGKYLETQIIGIHTELFFKEMYKGIVLFDEVDEYLKERGFYQHKRLGKKNEFSSDFLYLKKENSKKEKIKFIKKIYK